MTFVLNCALKDKRARAFVVQTTLVDSTRDVLLYIRCMTINKQGKTY
jgi:hypothetical protein